MIRNLIWFAAVFGAPAALALAVIVTMVWLAMLSMAGG